MNVHCTAAVVPLNASTSIVLCMHLRGVGDVCLCWWSGDGCMSRLRPDYRTPTEIKSAVNERVVTEERES